MQVFAKLKTYNERFGTHIRRHTRELVVALVFAIVAAVGYEWWHAREQHHAIEAAQAAVVTIIAYDSSHKAISQGSGFFVTSSGLLATNYHVIKGAAEVEAHQPSGAFFRLQEDGIRFTDPATDIALLQFDAIDTPFVKLGDPTKLTAGQLAYVIGSPDGQERTVSLGNISYPDRVISGQHLIQFNASISPGSSGGGLFVEGGDAVGITSYSRASQSDQNLNYAVPITTLRTALNKEATIAVGSPSYYYLQGNLAADRRDTSSAIKYYSKVIALNPHYAEAYFGRGGQYFILRQYEQQLGDYLKASELEPNDANIAYYLGTAYDDVGRFNDAIETYKKALARDPGHASAVQALILDYLAVGKRADATTLLPELSKLDSGLGKQMQLIVDQMAAH